MKKFKQVDEAVTKPDKTPMADKIINFEEVESIRIAVYHNSETPYVGEVIFNFASPQKEWDNATDLKLRNNLYKLNNIAYKMPADFQDAEPFYSKAVARAREFKKYTNSDMNNKLGIRFPDRYYTIPFTFMSYDPRTKTGILQITQPTILSDGTVDCLANYQVIDFELDKQGKGLNYCNLA